MPGLQPSASKRAADCRVCRAGADVPPGFTATAFITGIPNPRRLLILSNGEVLVAQQSQGQVTRLHDDGSGRSVARERYAGGFNEPYGLAWRGSELLVADQDGIWRVPSPGARPEPVTRRACSGPIAATTTGRSRSTCAAARCSPGSVLPAISASSRSRRRRSSGSTPTDRTRRPMPRARATRRRSPSTRIPAICGPSCRSATGSATICRPTI